MNLIKKYLNNIRLSEDVSLEQMENILRTNNEAILLDVRSPQEYQEGHISRAINIPLYELLQSVEHKIPNKETTIIAYCKSGIRSKKAVKLLKKIGYTNSYNLITN